MGRGYHMTDGDLINDDFSAQPQAEGPAAADSQPVFDYSQLIKLHPNFVAAERSGLGYLFCHRIGALDCRGGGVAAGIS